MMKNRIVALACIVALGTGCASRGAAVLSGTLAVTAGAMALGMEGCEGDSGTPHGGGYPCIDPRGGLAMIAGVAALAALVSWMRAEADTQ
jgi:hypothetical protein